MKYVYLILVLLIFWPGLIAYGQSNDELVSPVNYSTYIKMALNSFDKEKEYDEVLWNLNQAIIANPKNSLAYSFRARLYFRHELYNLAINDLVKASEFGSDEIDEHFLKGKCYYYIHRYQASVQELDIYLKFNSCEAEPYFFRSKAKEALKDITGANEDMALFNCLSSK
jgi:tetratricopeptide (TPR) repeat protein